MLPELISARRQHFELAAQIYTRARLRSLARSQRQTGDQSATSCLQRQFVSHTNNNNNNNGYNYIGGHYLMALHGSERSHFQTRGQPRITWQRL